MSLSKKLLSAIVSGSIACTAAAASFAMPAYADYYNTFSAVSKAKVPVTFYTSDASDEPFNVFDIYDAYKEAENAPEEPPVTTQVTTEAPPETTQAIPQESLTKESWGIDVSQWQGTVNWQAVKDAGVEFAIMRAGYGRELSQKDPTFDYNVQQAKAVGIDVGVYWYSYAQTVEDAKREAETCYQIIKDYDYDYPIYFDIEDPSQEYLSTATISAMVDAFCKTLEEKGYYVGVYSSAYFLSSKVYQDVLSKYAVWVAHFGAAHPAFNGAYGIWQYSSTGRVNGINGDVDLNHGYYNYPVAIAPNTYRKNEDGSLSPVQPAESTTAKTSSTPSTTVTKADDSIKGVEYIGAEVLDWNYVKDGGYDYAIINAGNGIGNGDSYINENFELNYSGAKDAGLGVGAYWITSALNEEEAVEEAKTLKKTIEGMKFEYPIYLQIGGDVYENMSVDEVSAIVSAFCNEVQGSDMYVGIYSYLDFFNTKLSGKVFDDFDILISSYGDTKPQFAPNPKYGIWEYSSSVSIDGIETSFTVSKSSRDFASVMEEYHKNGF